MSAVLRLEHKPIIIEDIDPWAEFNAWYSDIERGEWPQPAYPEDHPCFEDDIPF